MKNINYTIYVGDIVKTMTSSRERVNFAVLFR